jgi:hypothetical protein
MVAYLLSMFLLFRKNRVLVSLVIILSIALITFYHNEIHRYIIYYKTVLHPYTDNSFTARFDFWTAVLKMMKDFSASYLLGFPNYKTALLNYQSDSVIDSNYLLLLIKLGIGGLILFVLFLFDTIKKNIDAIYLIFFSLITWVTLALFDDYRLSFLTGVMLGIVNIKNSESNSLPNRSPVLLA